MYYTADHVSPVGKILLASDGSALTGLWFYGQKYFAAGLPQENTAADLPVFRQTAQWLDVYFSGHQPDFMPPLCLMGTPFQKQVWQMLQQIPYGSVTTYGALAAEIAKARELHAMSARSCTPCLHGPSAVQWGVIPFPLLCRATGSLAATAV